MKYENIKDTVGNWFVFFKWGNLNRFMKVTDRTPREIKEYFAAHFPAATNIRFKRAIM